MPKLPEFDFNAPLPVLGAAGRRLVRPGRDCAVGGSKGGLKPGDDQRRW